MRASSYGARPAFDDGKVTAVPELRHHHLLPSVRGDLPSKLGRHAEARDGLVRASSLTRKAREQAVLLERARQSVEAVGP